MPEKLHSMTVESGAFKVILKQSKFVERGHAVRFWAEFTHVKDGSVDPTSPVVKIFEGDSQIGTNQTPTKDAKGVYYLDYNVPSTSNLGPQVVEWSGTYSGLNILARAVFGAVRTVTR